MERFFQGVERKGLQVILSLFLSPLLVFICITYVFCFIILSQSSFMHCFVFVCFLFSFGLFFFSYKKNWKFEKYKNSVFVYIGTCVPWMAIETKFSKLCIFCSLDEHLYAQLSKWALWLMFVMSKVKWSLGFNTHITLFDGKY